MKPWKILTNLLLITLLALSASGVVSAKVASGLQNLGGAVHPGETAFNPLMHLAKINVSYDDASESPVDTKRITINGNAQVTRKAGLETTHASTSSRIANQQALRTDAQSVHLNQQIGTITKGQIKSRVRPDVATVRTDGKIDAFEVLSPGQTVQQQTRKLQNALGDGAGNIMCVVCE